MLGDRDDSKLFAAEIIADELGLSLKCATAEASKLYGTGRIDEPEGEWLHLAGLLKRSWRLPKPLQAVI